MSVRGAILWRIAKHTDDYPADDMSGDGARRIGGRWNSKGHPAVYAATSISLAALESLAHLRSGVVVANAFLIRIAVPAAVWKLRERVAIETLDASWSVDPPGEATIRFGDAWLTAASSPLLVVPSVIVPEESNVLINPVHPAAAKIKASVERRFLFDGRLRP